MKIAISAMALCLAVFLASFANLAWAYVPRCPEPMVNWDSLILRWHRVQHSNDYIIKKLIWMDLVEQFEAVEGR